MVSIPVGETVAAASFGFLFFLFLVVRGAPLRMGLARLRKRTFLITDEDTRYVAPAIKKERAQIIETKDGRVFGKTFRLKSLDGIRIGLAVPNEFVMTEPVIVAAIEADNKTADDSEGHKYVKMHNSDTKVRYTGDFVKLSELTKGLEERTVPVLVKGAMAQEAYDAVKAKEREPTKYGMMILMICIGLGFLAILLAKAGIF